MVEYFIILYVLLTNKPSHSASCNVPLSENSIFSLTMLAHLRSVIYAVGAVYSSIKTAQIVQTIR